MTDTVQSHLERLNDWLLVTINTRLNTLAAALSLSLSLCVCVCVCVCVSYTAVVCKFLCPVFTDHFLAGLAPAVLPDPRHCVGSVCMCDEDQRNVSPHNFYISLLLDKLFGIFIPHMYWQCPQ